MLGDSLYDRLEQVLASDDEERERRFSGQLAGRQFVHTVYIPADAYHHGSVDEWGQIASDALEEFGPVPGIAADVWDRIEPMIHDKLQVEPVEDLRIDFDASFGVRSDVDEDAAVRSAARAVSHSLSDRSAPLGIGIRIKSLDPATRRRAVRTLDLFLDRLISDGTSSTGTAASGRLGESPIPEGFRITVPRVSSVAQVVAMTELCDALEETYGLSDGRLRFEIQVELPQAIIGPDGVATVARMIHLAGGRCVGLHHGTYDYSSALGVPPGYQSTEHPAAEFAKQVMQVAAAGTGVPVSDGPTNVLPVGDTAQVRGAWALHARLVRRSLERGIYQGWDLHPAQLPSRYAATYAFYVKGLPDALRRLRHYLDRADDDILDEPATAYALADYVLRGLDCGAFAETALADAGPVESAPVNRDTLTELVRRQPG